MTICDRLESRSVALMALPAADGERREAEAHAASCPDCARSLREGARLLEFLDLGLEPAPGRRAIAKAEKAVLDEWDREASRAAPASRLLAAGCALGLFAILCALARHIVGDPSSLATAVAAAALAALLSASAQAGGRTVLAAVTASLALILAPTAGFVGGESGLVCLGLELAGGLAPLAIRRLARLEPPTPAVSAALAASAALAVQAALHLSCPVRSAMVHLLAFHFAGVVLAAAAGFGLRAASR